MPIDARSPTEHHAIPANLPLIVLVILLTAAAGLLPTAPAAAADPIKVIRDWQETRFSSSIVFHLEVEGSQKIEEIRLFYRRPNSSVWAYRYAAFTPDQRISASLELPTSGATFIPPGSRLQYYYTIRDTSGNVLQTVPSNFEYADSRFSWHQTQIGPLTLQYHDLSQSKVDAMTPHLEGQLQRIALILGLESVRPIRGMLYNQRSETADVFPFQSNTLTQQEVFHGFAFSAHELFVTLGTQPRVILHESAHLLLHQALGPKATAAPAWLNEGFASYVEPGSAAYGRGDPRTGNLPLRAMSSVPGNPEAIYKFYQKAQSVVTYLIESYGTESFQHFLGQLRQGDAIDAALLNIYGFDTDVLDQRWAAEVDGPIAPAPQIPTGRPSPFTFFNTFLLGGLSLAVMAIFMVRYAVRRLWPASDEAADGGQAWEDQDT